MSSSAGTSGDRWPIGQGSVATTGVTAVLRGGSYYQPQTSHWYFPQAYRLDQHGKYLLMAPCKDRSACIGFRCVVDAG